MNPISIYIFHTMEVSLTVWLYFKISSFVFDRRNSYRFWTT